MSDQLLLSAPSLSAPEMKNQLQESLETIQDIFTNLSVILEDFGYPSDHESINQIDMDETVRNIAKHSKELLPLVEKLKARKTEQDCRKEHSLADKAGVEIVKHKGWVVKHKGVERENHEPDRMPAWVDDETEWDKAFPRWSPKYKKNDKYEMNEVKKERHR